MCLLVLLMCGSFINCIAQSTIWEIGKGDKSSREFSLAPNKFRDFVKHDFGF